jgi:two-component system sensor histidine kinase CpxA
MTVRSLYMRMLVASFGTLLVAFVAFVLTFALETAPKINAVFRHFQELQVNEAAAAFVGSGAPAVTAYLERLHATLGYNYYLTDARGRDVVSGEDRSALLARGRFGRPLQVDGHIVLSESSSDGRFRLVILAEPPFKFQDFLPYYLIVFAAVALLWWLLAIGIASPLRQLTLVVDRFGRGDFESRARYARRDEIGNLAKTFDDMAGRIQTLLAAERGLLQDISHELRSPLARLSIGIELLRTTHDREHAITRLEDEVDRLVQLVGALIEVTRSEGDPSSRRSEAIDVEAIVRDVVRSGTIESDLRGCRIAVSGEASWPVFGDPELIRRAIDNVLRNAIRYAPPSTTIDVRMNESTDETIVRIRDAGPGVPDELLPRLTEAFFRVDPARTADTGGLGLGLAIARRAIQLHHGSLVAENANPGLLVTITIPHEKTPSASHVEETVQAPAGL